MKRTRTNALSVYVDVGTLDELDDLARREGRTLSKMAQLCVRAGLKHVRKLPTVRLESEAAE